ncbi:MAG: diaminopimelate epimerase [Defluviitaleaceae bacterium]|nr:diaminopimelate epimerase [Defluviitaleaceae bacterium]
MKIEFTKMQGCGNDYIYINCRDFTLLSPESLAVRLADRYFGIGGDGLVLIERSDAAHAKMRMFNADGSEGKMCGNAIRCIGKFLYDNRIVQSTEMSIETLSGIKTLNLTVENEQVSSVKVDMGRAVFEPEKNSVSIAGVEYAITCVSMGNPHAVVFCQNIDDLNLLEIGPLFEKHALFPDGVNTEFVELMGDNLLKMRVWERGSGETLACGTGACAAAVAAVKNGHCNKNTDIIVKLSGGELTINYNGDKVFMTGGCKKVFDGTVEI